MKLQEVVIKEDKWVVIHEKLTPNSHSLSVIETSASTTQTQAAGFLKGHLEDDAASATLQNLKPGLLKPHLLDGHNNVIFHTIKNL